MRVNAAILVLAMMLMIDEALAKCMEEVCVDARMQIAHCKFDPKHDAAFKDALRQFKHLPPGAGIDRMLAEYSIEITGTVRSATACAEPGASPVKIRKIDAAGFVGQSHTFQYRASTKDFCHNFEGVKSVKISGGCCEGKSPGFGHCSDFTLRVCNKMRHPCLILLGQTP